MHPTSPSLTLDAPIFLLTDEHGTSYIPGASARAFLFSGDQLIDLGKPTLDQVLARGARPGDRLCVYELDQQRLGCQTISANYQHLSLFRRSDWQPDITVTSTASTTLRLEVRGLDPGLTLQARLYPSSTPPGIPAPREVALTATGRIYTGSLTSSPQAPAFDGYVYLRVVEAETSAPPREAIIDYRLGGNPGSTWARGAPRGNPGSTWARGAPVLSSDGQAILYGQDIPISPDQFFLLQTAARPPAPPPWARPVGRTYRLTASSGINLANMTIDIGYLGDEVPHDQESSIQVYFLDEGAESPHWEEQETRLEIIHNEASAKIVKPGLYALMTSIKVPLSNPGWNLLYFYPGATQPITDALAYSQNYYTTVYGYDATDTDDPWKVYDVSVPPEWAPLVDDLANLEYGQAYWIRATEAITLYLRGNAQNSPAFALQGAGILSAPPATYYGSVPGATPGVTLTVQALVNGVLCGQTQTQTRSIGGRPQVVFAINVRAVGAGSDAGCGTPGQPVIIRVGQQVFGTLWDNNRVHQLMQIYLPAIRR